MSDDTEIHKKIQDVDQNTYAIAKQELEKKLKENEKVVLSAFPEICIDDFRTLETEDILKEKGWDSCKSSQLIKLKYDHQSIRQ